MLGDTIESIAWHKAGVFKEGVPAFTAPQPASALKVLHERAQERKTELVEVPQYTALNRIKLGLHGEFQKINASVAIAICASHLHKLSLLLVLNKSTLEVVAR